MIVIILVSCFSIVCSLDNVLDVNKVNGTSATSQSQNNKIQNATKFASEGGIVSTESSLISLLKDDVKTNKDEVKNNTALLMVINESGNTKETLSKPRKGAFDEHENVLPNSSEWQNEHQQPNSTKTLQLNETVNNSITQSGKLPPATNHTVNTNQTTNNTIPTKVNTTTLKPITKKPTTIKPNIVKKPTVLSFNELAKFDIHKNISTITTEHNEQYNLTSKPSSETLTRSQLPSPNKSSIISNKARNVNSHPGMITPLVISILVVPLFAVLGYMAFKRGREAWRNRHYKRMDFLLDGMYND